MTRQGGCTVSHNTTQQHKHWDVNETVLFANHAKEIGRLRKRRHFNSKNNTDKRFKMNCYKIFAFILEQKKNPFTIENNELTHLDPPSSFFFLTL